MKDNFENQASFSIQSDRYARYRPSYPPELFAYLASVSATQERALDCATGNGQAAIAIADYFAEVVAVDASPEQIQQAIAHPRVRYAVSAAETLDFPARSFDLITVAQALHWFDLPAFYRRVRYLAKPQGAIAVWAYGLPSISPSADAIIQKFLLDPIDPYWGPGNRLIFDRYRSLDFPFVELSPPAFAINVQWTLDQLLGYFGTWSALKRYKASERADPMPALKTELERVWGANQPKTATMDLYLRVGRLPPEKPY